MFYLNLVLSIAKIILKLIAISSLIKLSKKLIY